MKKFIVQSTDRQHQLHVVAWLPTQKPIAVVQLLTGMAEYIERYDALAQFLAARGIVVIGHDHVGQGHSVQTTDELGYFGPHGLQTLLNDCTLIGRIAHEEYPRMPAICVGPFDGVNACHSICQTNNCPTGWRNFYGRY